MVILANKRLQCSVITHPHMGPKLNRASVISLPGPPQFRIATALFRDFSTEEIEYLLAAAVLRKFLKGRTIIRSDEPATRLFLIRQGSVNYYRLAPDGRQVLLARLSAGDTFGLGTLVEKSIGYIGTAESLGETEVYLWDGEWIRQYVKHHPALALNALKISLEYIKMYSDRHLALVSGTAEDRLASTLVQLGIRAGHQHPRGLEVDITNEHLASLSDIGYFTASRLLNKWQKKGALEKQRGKVIIHCPERMLP